VTARSFDGLRVLRRCTHEYCQPWCYMWSGTCFERDHEYVIVTLKDSDVQQDLEAIRRMREQCYRYLDVCGRCRWHELYHVGGRCLLSVQRYVGGKGG
jgi:hypothetical protein